MSSRRRSQNQTNQQSRKDLPTKQQPRKDVSNMEFETRNTPNDLCYARRRSQTQTNEQSRKDLPTKQQPRKDLQTNKQSSKDLPANQQVRKDLPTTQPFVSNMDFQTRTTPNDLCCALKGLSAAQKSDLNDIGFESLTSFSIHSIPTALGYWLLVNYDHVRNELNIGSHIIKITPSKVHDVFGVPMGRLTVSENKRARKADVIREEWRNQFFQSSITVKDVIGKLKSCRKGGTLFKLNFLVLFNSVMGETTKSAAAVNHKFLASIMNEGDISNMDWCSYMITCLKRTKEGWNGKEPYNGPLTLLVVLYAHELQLKHNPENAITPAIQYVTTDYLVDLESSLHGKGSCLNDNAEAQVQSAHEGQALTVEGQTAIDQNVNVSQDGEDEDQFHSTNPDVTSVQTGSVLNLKSPVAGSTQRFMDGRIIHCNQPPISILRDENASHAHSVLLNGDDIEIIEPKQEECELDENASRSANSLENSSSRQSGMVYVKGYKVNRDVAPTLVDIIRKHGDIATACVLKSDLNHQSLNLFVNFSSGFKSIILGNCQKKKRISCRMQRDSTLMCHGLKLSWKLFSRGKRPINSTVCVWK